MNDTEDIAMRTAGRFVERLLRLKHDNSYEIYCLCVGDLSFPEQPGVKTLDCPDGRWTVLDSSRYKLVSGPDGGFWEFFSKRTGFDIKLGRTDDEDPPFCACGPTIADIEIVSGKCPKVNGRNCRFCYKSNGGDAVEMMKPQKLNTILEMIGPQLCQVAFGITGFYTNPYFPEMLKLCRSKGIIPNYTANGVDIDDAAVKETLDSCGRVAISCYEDAKDLCYSTMAKFGKEAERRGIRFPCNIHVVLSQETEKHAVSVLEDAVSGIVPNLGSIIFLRLKNVGRAKNLDPYLPVETYERILQTAAEKGISVGFDSCGCELAAQAMKKLKLDYMLPSLEKCESSRFSCYVNVFGQFYNCSFCEQDKANHDPMLPYGYSSFVDFWNSPEVGQLRNPAGGWKCPSCPFFDLDRKQSDKEK